MHAYITVTYRTYVCIICRIYLKKDMSYRAYNELLNINNKTTNNPNFKCTKDLNGNFAKEDTQMANSTRKDVQHH